MYGGHYIRAGKVMGYIKMSAYFIFLVNKEVTDYLCCYINLI